jgi:CRISPR type IV-associated protein Csf3
MKLDLRPLRISCDLAEPVVYFGDGMCFDGILAAAWMRDLSYGITSRWPTATRDEPWVRDLDLPLARWSVPYDGACDPRLRDDTGRVWGWCASSVHAEWVAHTRTEVRKRVAFDEMTRWSSASDVDVSAGRFKAHDLKLPSRLARRLEWYALGDARHILRVLEDHITAVGRKVGQGNGRVLRWRVEDAAADWSVTRDGRLTRPMPVGYARGMVQTRGVRPLYWHPSRQIECVVPREGDLMPRAA